MSQENLRITQRPDERRATKFARIIISLLLMLVVFGLLSQDTVNAQPTPDENSQLYLPLVNNQRKDCAALKSPTIFGVQTYGASGRGTPYFDSMMDTGATWLRVETNWSSVEPQNVTPDRFRWQNLDNVVRAANDGCMNVVFTVEGNPAWAATSTHGAIDKADVRELAEYLAAVVERYDGDGYQDAPGAPEIRYIELYNEPDRGDLPGVVAWGNRGAQYADMLRTVYPAMKAANPNVKVLLGGIAYDNFIGEEAEGGFVKTFLTDVLDAGGGAYFDIMNFHYYPLFAAKWTGDGGDGTKGIGLLEKTEAVRAVLNRYGLNKPIVITEGGWHSNADQPPISDERDQAVYALQMFMQSYAARVDFLIWWTLWDVGNFYPFANGLVTNIDESNPPRRKQSFNVYQVLTREIAPLRYVQRLPNATTGSAQIEAYQFDSADGRRTVYAAWYNPRLQTATRTFFVPASQVTERDMFWTVTRTLRDGDDGRTDGRVRITVSGVPKYFEVNR